MSTILIIILSISMLFIVLWKIEAKFTLLASSPISKALNYSIIVSFFLAASSYLILLQEIQFFPDSSYYNIEKWAGILLALFATLSIGVSLVLFVRFIDGTSVNANEARLKQTLVRLQELEKIRDLVNEYNPDIMLVKDEDFKIVDANKAFINLYPEEMQDKIIGYTTFEKYKKEEAQLFLEQDKKAFKDGYAETIEKIKFPNGVLRVLHTKKIRFKNKINNKKFILGIASDVTERENLISELKRSNEDLFDFAQIVSHDLKEPLRGIYQNASMFIENYKDAIDNDGMLKMYSLCAQAKNMEQFLNELLHYSRLSRKSSQFSSVDINKIVVSVTQSLEHTLKMNGITCIVEKNLPTVHCEGILVQEVFANIITNAIKYNDKSNKWIKIGCIHKDDEQDVFYIADNGIGIDNCNLEKVFQLFKRLNKKDDYGGGTGFGLTICKKIIDRHEGEIWVESKKGEGSCFYFTLGKN